MNVFFFDNTDPDGFDRVWPKLNGVLNETLVIVISKSGGTKETRNGMVEAETHYRAAGPGLRQTRGRRHRRRQST